MSLVAEAPGFIQVFSNGSVKRFIPQTATPSAEWSNISCRYKSKDIIIHPSKPITARIFLPTDHDSLSQQLPLLVYFHGGGFCIGSTTWLGYHVFLGNLSATAKTIVVSVDYRLAPENKLPIAYDDCYSALEWLSSSTSDSETWLRQADLSRVFLSGDSAGGNIAHQVAIKAIKGNIRIKGVVPIHPFFGSEARTELELADSSADAVAMNDMFWKLSLPEGCDRNFYGCNFNKGAETEWSMFPAVMVFVAGLDFLKERGVMYVDFLKRKGVKVVSMVEAEGEAHVFHVWNPESEATYLLQKQINTFMHSLL
ncbi:putative carboxylesterase 17 [Sesamum alatum]|uniref:Carboxylesterase 17 n=1 Tax=Sesamum alatum TaxID=300844 RepID=A0AAE1XXP5_9LAMI|nr:putative carboxylesterase 17 [Sesamum alatum]